MYVMSLRLTLIVDLFPVHGDWLVGLVLVDADWLIVSRGMLCSLLPDFASTTSYGAAPRMPSASDARR